MPARNLIRGHGPLLQVFTPYWDYSTVTDFAKLRGLWLRPPLRGLTCCAS